MPKKPDLPRSADVRQVPEDQPALPGHAMGVRDGLHNRLGSLPAWHPSSASWDRSFLPIRTADSQRADEVRARPEPLTDRGHAERVGHIRGQLAYAREHGLATDERFYNLTENRWSTERQLVHREVVDDLYAVGGDVPRAHKAIMAGGLGGAGKSTVLDKHAGIDRSQYLTINPDEIKEAMAKHGLIPELYGLSPLEASDLVHEESSHIAKLLAARAMKEGTNIIWDITMSSTSSTAQRLDDLEDARYAVSGIFVHIDIQEAVQRADARHRSGHERYRAGIGFGGRLEYLVSAGATRSRRRPSSGRA